MGWRSLLILLQAVAFISTAAGAAEYNSPSAIPQQEYTKYYPPFPTPERPMRLRATLDFSVTIAYAGLNNILWGLVYALRVGCNKYSRDKFDPRGKRRLNLAVVLPRIARDIHSRSNASAQHHYSEVRRPPSMSMRCEISATRQTGEEIGTLWAKPDGPLFLCIGAG